MSEFGKMIARARKAKGFTQTVAAAQIGVAQETWSRWENGRTLPELHRIVDLQRLLDLPGDDLRRLAVAAAKAKEAATKEEDRVDVLERRVAELQEAVDILMTERNQRFN